ncbi:hypothetical protein LCGC14_3067460, partial [marine sediment metagenome]
NGLIYTSENSGREKGPSIRLDYARRWIKDEFNEVKSFGNFNKMVFHKFFHYFYSVSVANSSMRINKLPDEEQKKLLKDLVPIKDMGIMAKSDSIDTKQLDHHDDLFKTIAYWYRLKLGDPGCYKVLLAMDSKEWKENYNPRSICEKIFAHRWDKFRKKIGTIGTDYPDVLLYLQLTREKETI